MNFNLRDRSTLTPVVRYGEKLRLGDFCTYTSPRKEPPLLIPFQQVIVPPPTKGVRYGENNQMMLSDEFWLRHPPHHYLKLH